MIYNVDEISEARGSCFFADSWSESTSPSWCMIIQVYGFIGHQRFYKSADRALKLSRKCARHA